LKWICPGEDYRVTVLEHGLGQGSGILWLHRIRKKSLWHQSSPGLEPRSIWIFLAVHPGWLLVQMKSDCFLMKESGNNNSKYVPTYEVILKTRKIFGGGPFKLFCQRDFPPIFSFLKIHFCKKELNLPDDISKKVGGG
jgi:hypothetical protein